MTTTNSITAVKIDTANKPKYNENDVRQIAAEAAQQAVTDLLNRLMSGSATLDNCNTGFQLLNPNEKETEAVSTAKIRRRININGSDCWISASSEQEYAEKAAALLSGIQVAKPSDGIPSAHNFKEFADNWFQIYNKPSLSLAAAITNERQLRLYLYPAFGEKNIEDITSDDIQNLFNSMENMKKASKDKTKNVLNMIFNHAIDQDIINKNPLKSSSIRITGGTSEKIPAYTVDEMKFFAASIDKISNPYDRAWFALMLFHPLRPEECLGLKHKNIYMLNETKVMQIAAVVTHPGRSAPLYVEKLKTDVSRRILQIAPAALPYIPDGEPEEFVVGGDKAMSYTMTCHMCERIAKDIGYEGKITPRRFRTTVASDLYAATHDEKLVQNSLGHSKHSATAMNHYIETRQALNTTGTIVQSVYLN